MSDEATTKRKVVIHRSDVPDDISATIVTNIKEALDKFQIEKVSSPSFAAWSLDWASAPAACIERLLSSQFRSCHTPCYTRVPPNTTLSFSYTNLFTTRTPTARRTWPRL